MLDPHIHQNVKYRHDLHVPHFFSDIHTFFSFPIYAVQHRAMRRNTNMHWHGINNHITLSKREGWLGAISLRRDKQETGSPSQNNCNVFWRLWVSWWSFQRLKSFWKDACEQTEATGSPKKRGNQHFLLWQPRGAEVKTNSPRCDWPFRVLNLSVLHKHGSGVPGKRHVIAR